RRPRPPSSRRTWCGQPAGACAAAPEDPPAGRRPGRARGRARPGMNAASLLHLLQFASPALPIGGYSYSQGLEAALEQGIVHDAATAHGWMRRYLIEVMAQWDAPIFWRLLKAFAARDAAAVGEWSECYLASRDTFELRAETVQMGYSLHRLIAELGVADSG